MESSAERQHLKPEDQMSSRGEVGVGGSRQKKRNKEPQPWALHVEAGR